MEEIVLLDAVERYLNGEMTAQEKTYFEDLRSKNPEVDQMVVEHHLFLNQLNQFGDQKRMKAQLHDMHNSLLETGDITKGEPAVIKGVKVFQLWNKHKRTIAVAASIAGITALTISGMTSYFSPKENSAIKIELGGVVNEVKDVKQTLKEQDDKINSILETHVPKTPPQPQVSGGSSFLIDSKGYLITNSHVVKNAATLVVVNNGKEYYARNVYNDPINDIAILKIEDKDFEALQSLPYSIRKTKADLGEEIFTLGYPRNQIVYGKGYLSSQSGFNDDTLSVQISVDANPGNSGGPVLDKNGDILGILNSREANSNGVVFANKASNIAGALMKLKEGDTTYRNVKLPVINTLKGKERTQQIKQLQDCVFMVKGYNK
ncbi:MAG: serine protease [Chitinophagaceae bacterium]